VIPRGPAAERGSITLLSIGFLLVALTFVMVVVESSAAFLAGRSLAATCDAAALAAADAVDAGAAGSAVPGRPLQLDPQRAELAVADYVDALAVAGDPDATAGTLRLDLTVDPAGTTARVRCTRPLRLPGIGWLGLRAADLPAVTAHALARSRVA
jgi:Putative Flp pilus-assembly TadE/G-like